MSFLFLVPARGGSKGLPGKNLALVGGIPMVGRTARLARQAALGLGGDHRVVCSTDDGAIADAARAWGAEAPFVRPAHLASDAASTSDVVLHALEALGGSFAGVVLLQPTSPLTEVRDVLGAVALHRTLEVPVVSVCEAEHPSQWHFSMDEKARLCPLAAPGDLDRQRQQTRLAYSPNGAIYVSRVQDFLGDRSFYTAHTRGFVMPAERSVDVDTAADLEVARAMLAARPVSSIEIADRRIGPGQPCFFIAEAGVNHNGSVEMAMKLVDAAKESGADAVKFQTFRAERLATRSAPLADYQIRTTGGQESQFRMLERLELDEAAHRALMTHCRERGILFLSSPFDEESCDLLDSLGVAAFKLPSGELTNLPFLRHAARKGKPLILSTGMATMDEVARAMDTVGDAGGRQLVLLHCVSNYPAAPADANLRAMTALREGFGVPAGFSDHTEGGAVALGAVALGACVVEKHLTLDRSLPGPDHQASIEPSALAALIGDIRRVEMALGDGIKRPAASEEGTARAARKSLVALISIRPGQRLEPAMVGARRPGTGVPPGQLDALLGRRARVAIPEGALLAEDMFE